MIGRGVPFMTSVRPSVLLLSALLPTVQCIAQTSTGSRPAYDVKIEFNERVPMRDGVDSIEWCAKQRWSSGKVGTIGSSYLGYDQWLAALQQPPHLATMIVLA